MTTAEDRFRVLPSRAAQRFGNAASNPQGVFAEVKLSISTR